MSDIATKVPTGDRGSSLLVGACKNIIWKRFVMIISQGYIFFVFSVFIWVRCVDSSQDSPFVGANTGPSESYKPKRNMYRRFPCTAVISNALQGNMSSLHKVWDSPKHGILSKSQPAIPSRHSNPNVSSGQKFLRVTHSLSQPLSLSWNRRSKVVAQQLKVVAREFLLEVEAYNF